MRLANGAVADKDVSAKTRRNMPDPIPVMVLARLAVDSAYQKQGLGSALLKDALLRTIAVSQMGMPMLEWARTAGAEAPELGPRARAPSGSA